MPPEPRLLLLDRDGTLMRDTGYPADPAEVELLPDAAAAVKRLAAAGFVPAIVSNQSGVGRGIISPEQAAAVHARFADLFEIASGLRPPAYYCPHSPDDNCDCRKPRPGLLLRAAADLRRPLSTAVMIGDKESDAAAGRAAGTTGVVLGPTTWADILDRLLRPSGVAA